MTGTVPRPSGDRTRVRGRTPRLLLFALLGDNVLDTPERPVRAGVFLTALEAAGVPEATTRATLDRLVRHGTLSRLRRGREVQYLLTPSGAEMLRSADQRVRGEHPLDCRGGGWTLVTFSIPETRRALRHRLRATLTWAGFAPLRDGLWLAPGALDLSLVLGRLRDDLPADAVVGFHARELDGFPIAASVRDAWEIERIRASHEKFIEIWSTAEATDPSRSPLVRRTELVADWLTVLREDPGLPSEYMDADWPGPRSVALYRRLYREVYAEASAEFDALTRGDAATA